MMINDNVIEDIANIVLKNLKTENPALQLLKQRLSETETALNNLLKAIEQGVITPTTKQRMLELEQTRDEINLKLIKEEIKKPTITKEGLVLWLKHIQSMSLETKEHKQRLIDVFVNAVYLYTRVFKSNKSSEAIRCKNYRDRKESAVNRQMSRAGKGGIKLLQSSGKKDYRLPNALKIRLELDLSYLSSDERKFYMKRRI